MTAPLVERWVDERVELLVDGVVVADSSRFGVVAGSGLRAIALPAEAVDERCLRVGRAARDGSTRCALEVGRRRLDSAAIRLPGGRSVVFDLDAVDECWIGRRLITLHGVRMRAAAGAGPARSPR